MRPKNNIFQKAYNLTIALLFICCFFTVNAQDKVSAIMAAKDTLDQPDPKNIDEVTVLGQTAGRKVKEEPFNVNVIETAKHFNSTQDLNQLLTRTTGIRVREDGGLGSDFRFSLNGFSGKSVKFFIDGMPMDNFSSSLSLNNFPATMAERIEIYKGAVPMTLGADALGGAINIVTRNNPNYLDVSYSIGSFNTHKAGLNGAVTNPENGLSVRFNGFYNYSDNNYKVDVRPIRNNTYLPEQEVERFHDSYASIGGQAEVGFRDKSFADQLFIGLIASKNDKDIQTGVVMEQVYGALTRHSSSLIPTLKYKKTDFFIEGLDFNLYSAYNTSKNALIDTVGLVYNWLQETTPNSITAERQRTQQMNNDRDGLITANLSYALHKQHNLSLNYVLTDFKRKTSDVEDPDNVTYKMPQRLQKQNIGLGLDSRFGNLRTNIFAKYYKLHAESFENVSQNNIAEYQSISTDRNNLGYGIAGTYHLLSSLQFKASYEHTYRLPEPSELLGDGLFTIRNENIKPEKSDNINVGALYGFLLGEDHRFQTEANFIYRNSKDYIRLEQARNQPTGRKFINVGDVETTGAEAAIRYSWRELLFANASLSYQHIIDKTEFIYSTNLSGTSQTKNLNYGYKIPNTPYLFGNLDLGTRIGNLGKTGNTLHIHYLVNFIEKYYLTPQQLGLNNTDIIPRQWAHSILADYSLRDGKYNIAVECHNLADSKLFDNYRLQKPGRSFAVKIRYFINKHS
ncbi:TonB-dependent receptor plug domain-containing protein [Sphingobacterium sp. SGG-5]|uniref:TonB-dependent receptor plug domain-containing protein n=1 Tax=Sphingobacterium sp. SGG-5 TaxID=2710881 RepID=UPI0013EB1630|nr:TonB-dependent receptor [Sphingobacterium sp. SGG-5]NGM62308.1 TonB-dependent receptor plug domain-containing protein [Sphingobacterium sp. SGG-5]